MEVEYCEFPENIYIDLNNDVWLSQVDSGRFKMGITTWFSFLAGRITKINLKTGLQSVKREQSVGTIESSKYFGAIRSPVDASVLGFNNELSAHPSLLNESPYEKGWICELTEVSENDLQQLPLAKEAQAAIQRRIKELKVRCFKALPDEELNAVGVECAATLVNLNDLLSRARTGTVVHIVSDDPTSDLEILRWSDQTGNEFLESRKEGNIYHFLVRKTK